MATTTKYYYEYVWDIKFEIPSRNIAFRPYSIQRFVKNCDYFHAFMPSYYMIVKIDDINLDVLRTYDKELVVTVKQYKYYGSTRDKLTDYTVVMQDTFIPFYDKGKIPDYSKDAKTVNATYENLSSEYIPNTMAQEMSIDLRVNLLRKNDLLMKKYIHNYVLGSPSTPITPADAVSLIIDQNPYVDKFLMDTPDNTNTYPDLVVKLGELKNAIKQIQLDYGIYSKDLLLFIDGGFLYVLNKLNADHAAQDKEITSIVLYIDERGDRINPIDFSVVNNDEKYAYYQRSTKIVVQDEESILGETVGDKFVYSNFNSVLNAAFGTDKTTKFVSPLNSIDRPANTNVNTGTKKIVDYDMLNNPYNMSSYVYNTALGVPVGVNINSINCDDFAPNKKVKLLLATPVSNKLYSGVYNIAQCTFLYESTHKTSERYKTFGHCTLSLVNKQDGKDIDYAPAKAVTNS